MTLIHGLRPFDRPPAPKGSRLTRVSWSTVIASRPPGVRRACALRTAVRAVSGALLAVAHGMRPIVALTCLLLLASPARAYDPFITTNDAVDQARELVQAGRFAEALAAIEAALKVLPESAALHFDAGSAQLGLGAYEAAEESLRRALDMAAGPMREATLYNLGLCFARWALQLEGSEETAVLAKVKWEAAAERFEATLLENPDSADALHNLELALLRAYPPCRSRDDAFEPNDAPEAAPDLPLSAGQPGGPAPGGAPAPGATPGPGTGFKDRLRLCEEDADWFALALTEGDRVSVAVRVSPDDEEEPPDVRPEFDLYEPDGRAPVAARREGEDAESMKAGPITTSGRYLIGVKNPADEPIPYELEVSVLPRCDRIDDTHEPNDTFAQARQLEPGNHPNLRVCPGDEDLFKVALAESESLLVVLQAQPLEGRPMVQLLGEDFSPLSAAIAEDGQAMAVTFEPGPGVYYIRVFAGSDGESPYSLDVAVVPPCPAGNDPYEPNEHAADAKPLGQPPAGQGAPQAPPGGPGQSPGGQGAAPGAPTLARVCPGDQDVFRLTPPEDKPAVVKVMFQHDKGDLVLERLSPDGEQVKEASDRSSAAQNGEALALPPEDREAEVLIRLRGVDEEAENFYLIKVDQPEGQPDNQRDQKKDEDKDKDEQEQEPKPKPEPDDEPEPQQEPMDKQLEKMDRNPKNLEAERARRLSPYRDHRPGKDW